MMAVRLPLNSVQILLRDRLTPHCIVTKFIAYNLAKQENFLLNSLIIAKIDIHRDYNFVSTHRKYIRIRPKHKNHPSAKLLIFR